MSQRIPSNFSRRRLLQTSLLAGLDATLVQPLRAATSRPPAIYKSIPSTGEKIPVMGIGTNQFTNTDYPIVRDLLKRMHELGGTVINTASAYRDAEILIGKALRELDISREMFVSTMFDAPGVNGMKDMTPGKESVERSFQRLGKVDLMFVHLAIGLDTMMPILQDLKEQGRVRYIGITSVYHPNENAIALQHLRRHSLDFIQLPYSLADRSMEKEFLPLAQERKVAVQAAIPFGGSRNLLFKEAANRKLPPWAADLGISTWAQFFLKWAVSHSAVTCAVPGSTKVSHLEDNQGAGLGRLPDPDERKRMQAFWEASA